MTPYLVGSGQASRRGSLVQDPLLGCLLQLLTSTLRLKAPRDLLGKGDELCLLLLDHTAASNHQGIPVSTPFDMWTTHPREPSPPLGLRHAVRCSRSAWPTSAVAPAGPLTPVRPREWRCFRTVTEIPQSPYVSCQNHAPNSKSPLKVCSSYSVQSGTSIE